MPKQAQVNLLMAYDWPGNVRELRNLAERYVLLGAQYNWMLERMLSGGGGEQPISLPEQIDAFERAILEQALTAHKGCIKDVMEALVLPRKTLYDKLRKYDLDKNDFK